MGVLSGNPSTMDTSNVPVIAGAINNSSAVVSAASAVATLAAVPGMTTYLSSIQICAGGATGASLVTAAVTGLLNGTMSIIIPVQAGATLGNAPVVMRFDPAIPASAVNTAIVLTLPSLGTGNTKASVSAQGFYL